MTQGLKTIGVLGLVGSTIVSTSRLRTAPGALAVLWMAVTVPRELVLIAVAAEDNDSSAVSAASSVFGVGVLLANVVLIGFGIMALRQCRWTIPWRALPLAYALFNPLIATSVSLAYGLASLASFIVIAVADLLMALIGVALLRAETIVDPDVQSTDHELRRTRSLTD